MLKSQSLLFQQKIFPALDESFLYLKNEIKKNKKMVDINATQLVKPRVGREGSGQARTPMSFNCRMQHEKFVNDATGEDETRRFEALSQLPIRLTNPDNAAFIIDLDICEKLCQLFRRYKQGTVQLCPLEVELVLSSFVALSTYVRVADQLAAKPLIIADFYKMIIDLDKNEAIVCTILKQISEKTFSLQVLVKTPNLFNYVKQILTRPFCTLYFPADFWAHLVNIVEQAPHDCFDHGFFDIFLNRIKKRLTNYAEENMKCMAILLNTAEAQDYCFTVHAMKVICELITPTTPVLETYEFILMALRNATKNDLLIEECRKFHDLPDILLNLAVTRDSINEQLYALETIKNIGKVYWHQLSSRSRCAEGLRNLKTISQAAEHIRMDLIRGIATPLEFFALRANSNTNGLALSLNSPAYAPPY